MEQQVQPLETAPVAPAEIHAADELTAMQSETTAAPLDQEQLEALNGFLHSETRKARQLNWIRNGVLCAWALSFVLTGIFWNNWKHPQSFNLVMQLMNLVLTAFASSFKSERHKQALATLTKANDVRYIGTLAEALTLPAPEMQALAGEALVRLLPHLQATDASLLNEQQRNALRPLLKRKNKPLVLALLLAYEQVGDGRDLPAVQAILEGKGKVAKDPEVRAAAEACLPFLEINARRRQAQQTLLRAAEQPTVSPEELLRPAQSGSPSDPEQLLRSSDEA